VSQYRLAATAVGVLSAVVLLLTSDYQIYDNNLYTLSEAIALLHAEHPYRDFFEWGVPLQAVLSALMQRVLGYRLLSEFLLQWTFIVAGLVMAFAIAVRLSHSIAVSLAVMSLAAVDLAATPTYQFTKLFVYPAAVILIWRYMERPDVRRAVWLGVGTAAAFFFRHDHGIYVGIPMLLGMLLARVLHGRALPVRAMAANLAACGLACAVFVVPWALVVERSEGLVDYVEARLYINHAWSVQRPVFSTVLDMNPIRVLTPEDQSGGLGLPARDHARDWLHQVTLLTTMLAMAAALVPILRGRRRGEQAFRDGCHLLVAAAVAGIVERQLFREPSYYVCIAPLVAALGARLLAGSRDDRTPLAPSWLSLAIRGVGVGVLLVTVVAVAGFARESNILRLRRQLLVLPDTLERLAVSPPIDGLVSPEAVRELTPERWAEMGLGDRSDMFVRYLHDCTAPGDHLFVSGQTPYQIGYYTNHPVAAGHLYWHDRWRSDPKREAQSLALLERQSVPFAYATHNPIAHELAPYPRLLAYFEAHYRPIEHSEGRLLYDTRRMPTGTFGKLGLPCFAAAR
jgi:hypothetical protein